MRHISEIIKASNKALLDRGYRVTTPCELYRAGRRRLTSGGRDPVAEFFGLQADPEFWGQIKQSRTFQSDSWGFNRTDPNQLRLGRRANWYNAPEELREFGSRLYLRMTKEGFPVYFHTCYRSPHIQSQLVAAGHSNLRNGAHQRSAAFDIVHSHYHWKAPPAFWRVLGVVGEEIIRSNNYKIEWGGHWSDPYDPAHWQMANWDDLPVTPTPHEPVHRPMGNLVPYGSKLLKDLQYGK